MTARPRHRGARRPRLGLTALHRGARRPRLGLAALAGLLALLVGIGLTLPATEGAFTAKVANSTDTLATATSFNAGTLPYRSTFAGSDAGWTTYGGCWQTATYNGFGTYAETCGGSNGQKSVTGSTSWGDVTMQADVKIDTGTQAGLIFRVNSPTVGTDAFQGYYAAVNTNGTLTLGRMNNGYTPLQSAPIASGIALNTWYHLVVQASGCTFTLTESTVGAYNTTTSYSYTDSGCVTTGAVGVRDQDSKAAWRFVTVTAGATTSTAVSTYNAPFATGTATGYTTYGGTWSGNATTETYADTAGGLGDKSVEARTDWTDMSLTGDVQFTTLPATGIINAGFNVRVTSPTTGTDGLKGYYAGITRNALELGRHDGGTWKLNKDVPLGRTVQAGEWWHITLEAVGCTITATAQPSAGGQVITNAWSDTGCTYTSGAIGLRTLNVAAAWRNVAVTPR